MDFFKPSSGKHKAAAVTVDSKSAALRQQRLAHEDARKAAGTWGDMSVGTITRDDRIFVYYWKGNVPATLSDLAIKKPKEINDADHAALIQWLKSGRFERFVQAFAAWNVSSEEAEKIKGELVAKHRNDGLTIINPPTA